MALDPSIILHASDAFNKLPNYGEVMAQRTAIQGQQQALAEHNAAYAQAEQDSAKADAKEANRISLGKLAASGDTAGARKGALGSGDLELVGKLDAMGEADRKRTFEITQNTAPLLLSLRKLPPEQRMAGLQQIAPQLQAAGFTPEHIQQVGSDLSDGALDRVETSAMTIAQYQESRKPYTLGQYDRRFGPDGQMIAEGAQPTKYQLDTETGQVVQVGGPGAGQPGSPGAPALARTTGGWTPRARNGGDNTDAAVDGKIGGMARVLGVDPNADLRGMSVIQIANALTISEGGKGSLADRNNNPANIKNPDGTFKRFPTRDAGLAAAGRLVQRKLANGQTTIKTLVEGLPVAGAPAAGRGSDLSPQDIEYAAEIYRTKGTMPPLGNGPKAAKMRAQIIHAAAVQAGKAGSDGAGDAANQAGFKADTASLATLTRYSDQVLAYERTANTNATQVLQTMGKGAAGTGAPVFNAWVQHGRANWAGNADVSRFNVAVQTFATEYAKVVSGASGGAVTSDSARHEIMGMINNAQTPQQLQAVISQARTEMANRKKGLQDQQAEIRGRLKPNKSAVRVQNAADYNALPKGALYIAPGETRARVKQ